MTDAFDRETLAVLPDVLRFAKFLEGDADAAADLVQETYLRAYSARASFDASRAVRQWLFTICRNVFLRSRERSRWTVPLESDAELEATMIVEPHRHAVTCGLDAPFTAIDFFPALERGLAQLAEPYRVAFALVDMGELSYQEAAEQLGVPIGTVRSRLFRARRVLQESLIAHALDAGIAVSLSEDTAT